MTRRIVATEPAVSPGIDISTAHNTDPDAPSADVTPGASCGALPAYGTDVDSPPAYDSLERGSTPQPQRPAEKLAVVLRPPAPEQGSSSNMPHVGTSASASYLPATLAQGARYMRRQFVEAPRRRQEVTAQAEVLVRQAALAQLADDPDTAVMLYDAAFAALDQAKVAHKEHYRLLFGAKPKGTVAASLAHHLPPLQLALGRKGNAQVLVCLCRIWGGLEGAGTALGEAAYRPFGEHVDMLRGHFGLAWLDRHGKEALQHIKRSEDEAAAQKLQALQSGLEALETRFESRLYWSTVPKDPFVLRYCPADLYPLKSSALAEVVLFGSFAGDVDRHEDANRQLWRLLRNNACDRSTAVLLRHDDHKKAFTAVYLEHQVDEACAAAQTGEPARLAEALRRVQHCQALAGIQVMTNKNGALKRLLTSAVGTDVETRAAWRLFIPRAPSGIFATQQVQERASFLTFEAQGAPLASWLAIVACFGLKSEDIWMQTLPGAEGRELIWLRDASRPAIREPGGEAGRLAYDDGILPVLRASDEQAPQLLAWALRAGLGAEFGLRWEERLGLDLLDRLSRALADVAEREQAEAFMRGLMKKHQTAPTSLVLALAGNRQMRTLLPPDIIAWLDTGDDAHTGATFGADNA